MTVQSISLEIYTLNIKNMKIIIQINIFQMSAFISEFIFAIKPSFIFVI